MTVIAPMSRLDAVNIAIATAGRPPVSSLDGALPASVSSASVLIDAAVRELQIRNWYFNTLENRSLVQDVNGRFPVAPNVVECDIESSRNVTLRGGFLYDLDKDTDVFDASSGPLTARIVSMFAFEDLPEAAKIFVARKAARRYAQLYVRDQKVVQTAAFDESTAFTDLSAMDLRQADLNVRTTDVGRRVLNRRGPRG